MLSYFKKYPISLIIIATIFYLSFFTPPKTDMEKIPHIDKLVHLCMYGGLCFILWIEYLRTHQAIHWKRIAWGGIITPIAMSGCIELLQAYCTDSRSGDWLDFLANSTGVGLATCVGYYILRPLMWRKRQ
ncbi:VanZ family protein [Phocaeicola sp.]|uniref:VanZ family protein n=1 Tax=Phocaeicola sp. TaxID=2773926 RepID=UPI0023CBEF05|nr:VanZ family protein [Phocaeicola sp.]MDE5677681.1 VanZ family protein [Phocaeicola sp.]